MSPVRNKIFISYRREDSSGHVGRLHDALASQLGHDTVFMDIDSIAPGADFVEVLQHSLQAAAVVIVVIGTRWVGQKSDGTRRIDDENDFVRIEVAKALNDSEVRVIPVLVNKAEMFSEASLPEPLKALARRNAMEMSEIRWAHDTKMLLEEIARTPGDRRARASIPKSVVFIGALVALMLVLFVWRPWQSKIKSIENDVVAPLPAAAVIPSNIPKAIDGAMPRNVVAEARTLLVQVNREWKKDAFVDEITADCRREQCETIIKFLSPELMQGLTATKPSADEQWQFANERGTVQWNTEPIPMNSMDLDEALTKVHAIGLVGPIMAATLSFAHPRGGQALLVWSIIPKVFRNGGQRQFCLDAKTSVQYECNQLR
ncbi:MAG: toll/interleukin-1 receptor domain-containing protein [Gemmatimonadaceae bacterium]